MRSDATQFALSTPPTLQAVLAELASGTAQPFAGGTELMVALNTGRLAQRTFVNVQHLRELRFIRVLPDAVEIGAGTTFTDLRRHDELVSALPLLAEAASWTGSVANQNRGTLGGNLCNASPAADSPPALLAYGATLRLVSATGERVVSYDDFHLGYKRTALLPGELLHTIIVRRPAAGHHSYIRKVGAREAQAISKVALAATATLSGSTIAAVRLGAASLADRPLRLTAAEEALRGASLLPEQMDDTVRLARAALARQAAPIDDIRSTALYRTHVAANLLEQFVRSLAAGVA